MPSFTKKTAITISAILLSTLLLTACTSDSEENSPARKMVEIDAGGSCYEVQLQNQNGNEIKVPEEIEENFKCMTESTKLSPNTTFLTYTDEENNLKLYDLDTKEIITLTSFEETPEGLACRWKDNSQEIAYVEVNQQKYEGLTKIIVIKIDETGKVTQRSEFEQKEGETVDYVCGASCYPGEFWFEEEEGILKYNGHEIISPNQIYTIKY